MVSANPMTVSSGSAPVRFDVGIGPLILQGQGVGKRGGKGGMWEFYRVFREKKTKKKKGADGNLFLVAMVMVMESLEIELKMIKIISKSDDV